MAPILLLAFALLAQDAPAPAPATDDGPVATAAPRKQDVAPLPIQGGPVSPPTDDYGYVGWCFGAVSGYVDLYDRAMPEVIRIERAWPTPSTEENIKEVYPAQKREAAASLELFRRAIEAAEKASPTPIAQQGASAIKKGRGVWTGATTVPKAQLAQFWMSWSPPRKCEETAKALEARSNLFGQALTANTAAAPVAPQPKPEPAPLADASPTVDTPADAPLAPAAMVETAAADEVDAPAAAADTTSDVGETPPVGDPIDPVAAVENAALADDAAAVSDGSAEADAETTDLATTPPAAEPVDPVAAVENAPLTEDAEAPAMDMAETSTADAPAPEAAPSAIDDLLSAPDAPAPAVEDEAAAEAAPPAPPAKPVAAPAKPKPTRKPGLRDTLKGLRGPQ